VVFGAIYLAALRTPPLLDDADASHAQAGGWPRSYFWLLNRDVGFGQA